jgi:hypothetical protein
VPPARLTATPSLSAAQQASMVAPHERRERSTSAVDQGRPRARTSLEVQRARARRGGSRGRGRGAAPRRWRPGDDQVLGRDQAASTTRRRSRAYLAIGNVCHGGQGEHELVAVVGFHDVRPRPHGSPRGRRAAQLRSLCRWHRPRGSATAPQWRILRRPTPGSCLMRWRILRLLQLTRRRTLAFTRSPPGGERSRGVRHLDDSPEPWVSRFRPRLASDSARSRIRFRVEAVREGLDRLDCLGRRVRMTG